MTGDGIFYVLVGPSGAGKNTLMRRVKTFIPDLTQVPTMTPTWTGPTPPWLALAATYTPTPLYVNTPHPIIEAYRLSIRAFERQEWDKAIGYLQQSIQSEPNTADLPYLLGEAYRWSGQYGEAAKAYDQSLQANAGFAPAYLGRALNQWPIDPNQVDQIRSDLEAALTYDPHLPETLTQLGRWIWIPATPSRPLERSTPPNHKTWLFRSHITTGHALTWRLVIRRCPGGCRTGLSS